MRAHQVFEAHCARSYLPLSTAWWLALFCERVFSVLSTVHALIEVSNVDTTSDRFTEVLVR